MYSMDHLNKEKLLVTVEVFCHFCHFSDMDGDLSTEAKHKTDAA